MEDEIVRFLSMHCPSIGDDGAVLAHGRDGFQVISKDVLVEDVHFRLSWSTPENLAFKALEVNLSDLAAMGAEPYGVFVGLSFPQNKAAFAFAWMKAFVQVCQDRRICLLGGDTTRSPGPLFISITVLGTTKHPKLRSHGLKGDLLCVAGNLGWAHMGWQALEKNTPGLDLFKESFLRPRARIEEGLWLSHRQEVRAMMDLSDGLWIDGARLAQRCRLKVSFDEEYDDPLLDEGAMALDLDPREVRLMGGEDYGLLFSVRRQSVHALAQDFRAHFGYALETVGALWGLSENLPSFSAKMKPFSHFEEERIE